MMKEIISLVALLLGIWGTYKFSDIVADWLGDVTAAHTIAFVVTFIVVLILVHVLGSLAARLIKVVIPAWVDRLLGICFGIFKVLFICAMLLYVIQTIDSQKKLLTPKVTEKSYFYHYIDDTAYLITEILT